MARRNNSRKMPTRPMRLPMIGDPEPAAPPRYNVPSVVRELLADDIETRLANMSPEELFNVALSVGVKATDALGVSTCGEHFGYKELGGRVVPKLNYATDVVWCHSCFCYYRTKS